MFHNRKVNLNSSDIMILCPECGNILKLQECICQCGFKITKSSGIFNLHPYPEPVLMQPDIQYISYSPFALYYDDNRKIDSKLYASAAATIQPLTVQNSIVLDLGAGTGIIGLNLAKLNIPVITGDISMSMLEICRNRMENENIENIILMKINALHLPFPDQSLDGIVVRALLAHIRNWKRVIKEIRRVLSLRGRLFVIHESSSVTGKDYSSEVWTKYTELIEKQGKTICEKLGASTREALEFIKSEDGIIEYSHEPASFNTTTSLDFILKEIQYRSHPSMRLIDKQTHNSAVQELKRLLKKEYGEEYCDLKVCRIVEQHVSSITFPFRS